MASRRTWVEVGLELGLELRLGLGLGLGLGLRLGEGLGLGLGLGHLGPRVTEERVGGAGRPRAAGARVASE